MVQLILKSRVVNRRAQVRVLPGHSDDEKPHGAHDGVEPKDVHPKGFGPTSVQFEGVVAPRVSV